MIDLTVNEGVLASAVKRAKARNFKIPTFKQMRDPSLIPADVKNRLASVGLWDLNPLNLYRITWHNEPTPTGGGFGGVNYLEIPSEISGVDARIVMLEGKWFPTGAHKVGAARSAGDRPVGQRRDHRTQARPVLRPNRRPGGPRHGLGQNAPRSSWRGGSGNGDLQRWR